MDGWRSDPGILWQLLAHQAGQNPVLRRGLAMLHVLARRGCTPWERLVREVEAELGPGVFGAAPQARLWGDLRVLRAAGVSIGYRRARGIEGYFLRAESLGEPAASAIRQAFRELDFAHLDRVARVLPERRVEAVFEMIDLAHDLAAAGQRDREQG